MYDLDRPVQHRVLVQVVQVGHQVTIGQLAVHLGRLEVDEEVASTRLK